MMLAPLWIALTYVVDAVVALIFLGGLILFLRASFRRGGGLHYLAGLGLMSLAFMAAFGASFSSPWARAQSVAVLPPEAQIVKFELGDWGGGEVVFRLPEDRPVSRWIDRVWNLNTGQMHGAGAVHDYGQGRLASSSESQWNLFYRDKDRVFVFRAHIGL